MISSAILCYKISYCLGVPTETLQYEYPALHEAVESCDYLHEIPTVTTFRAISHVYFYIIRNAMPYIHAKSRGKSFRKVSGKKFRRYTAGTGFSPAMVYNDSETILEMLNKLSEQSRRLLPQVFDELRPAVSYSSFESLVRLPELSQQEFEKVQYNMRLLPEDLNVYFFMHESFNIAPKVMLRSDRVLLKALRIALGRPHEEFEDASKLAEVWQEKCEALTAKRFLNAAKASSEYSNIYLCADGIDAPTQSQILAEFLKIGANLQVVSDMKQFEERWAKASETAERPLLICRRSKGEIDALAAKYSALHISVSISMEQELYRDIIAGRYSNVTAFSVK